MAAHDPLLWMAAQAAPQLGDTQLAAQWSSMQDPNFAAMMSAQMQHPAWAASAGVVTPAMAMQGAMVGAQNFAASAQAGAIVKGKGKPKGESVYGNSNSDAILIALNTAMQNVPPEELISSENGAWDSDTLKKRLAKYFRSAAKGLAFGSGDYKKVINDYADSALSNVSWALQGTKWLPKADFTLVCEVAIGELFPDHFKESIPADAHFEELILAAHDRALEEARFSPLLMETVKEIVEGKKSQNKVYNSAEAARKDVIAKMLENQDESLDFFHASENGVIGKIEEFAKDWIHATYKGLGDWPEGVLELPNAVKLFQKLLGNEECCLPRSLVRYMVEPLPEPWEHVENVLKEIYAAAAAKNAEEMAGYAKKRKRDEGPNFQYKTEMCRNIETTGTCRMGDWCVFAHSPDELWMHKESMKGMMKGKAPPEMWGKGAYPDFAVASVGKGGPKGMDPYGYGDPYGKGYGAGGKDPWGKGFDKGYGKPFDKGYDKGYGGKGKDFGKDYGKDFYKGKGKKGSPRPSSALDYEPSYSSSPSGGLDPNEAEGDEGVDGAAQWEALSEQWEALDDQGVSAWGTEEEPAPEEEEDQPRPPKHRKGKGW